MNSPVRFPCPACARPPQAPACRAAFTLIEVMVAVAIISMLVLVVNRFVVAQLTALRISSEAATQRRAMQGLVNLIQGSLWELPTGSQNLLMGQPHKFNNRSSDTMEWASRAGVGLLTAAARGEYRVALELNPVKKGAAELELGLRRWRFEGTTKEETWVSLMRPVSAIEIRYYHPQLNSKVDRWTDGNSLPTLVYLSIQRNPDEPPFDAVLTVPAANLQK